MSATNLGELIDGENIRDCIARVSRGEDRHDTELLSRCYWPDAGVDHGIFWGACKDTWPGSCRVHPPFRSRCTPWVKVSSSSKPVPRSWRPCDGGYHRIDMGGEERDIVIGGRYLDRMERRDQEWRISHRVMLDAG